MNFYSVRDLRTDTKNIFDKIKQRGEAVITNNGKPTALILAVTDDDFDITMRAVRQAKAMIAFNEMRRTAADHGFMTSDEIDAEIQSTRAARRIKS